MMDTRQLYFFAIAISLLSGGLFYFSGKSARLPSSKNQDLSYTATGINLLKTSETGQLEATTSAAHLQHWIKNNQMQLKQLNSTWYVQGVPNATFRADEAMGYHGNERVVLSGHVQVERLATPQAQPIRFTTSRLTGYPASNRIETDQPVLIQTSQGHLRSQGLQINLDQEQFDFFSIRGQYAPASGS